MVEYMLVAIGYGDHFPGEIVPEEEFAEGDLADLLEMDAVRLVEEEPEPKKKGK